MSSEIKVVCRPVTEAEALQEKQRIQNQGYAWRALQATKNAATSVVNIVALWVFNQDLKTIFKWRINDDGDPYYTLNCVGKGIGAIKDPEVMSEVFKGYRNDDSKNSCFSLPAGQPFHELLKHYIPGVKYDDALLLCHKDKVGGYRSILQTHLSKGALEAYLDSMKEEASSFLDGLSSLEQPINMTKEIRMFACRTLIRLILGSSSLESYKETCEGICILLDHFTAMLRFKPLPKKIEQAKAVLIGAIDKAIGEVKEKKDNASKLIKDMWDAGYSDNQIKAMILTLFIAGVDTSSTILTLGVSQIAQNHDLQIEVQQEISHLESTGKNFTEACFESKNLLRIVIELLRKTSSIPAIPRNTRSDTDLLLIISKKEDGTEFKRYYIKAGTPILGVLSDAAHHPKICENADSFNPHRKELEESSEDLTRLPFHAFGVGKHTCPGSSFFQARAILFLGILCSDHKFTTTMRNKNPETIAYFTARLKDEVNVTFTKQKQE